MLSWTLYKREMKSSLKQLAIFAAILTLYVSIIISMFDPKMMAMLDGFMKMMPKLMASVGMRPGATSLMGFMISYLYGFILLIFPMAFSMLRANGLVARYVERGSMAALLAAPVKRVTIVLTQACVLLTSLLLLVTYATVVELITAQICFPGQLALGELLRLNAGLICLHAMIGGICFLFSCVCSETRYSIALGAGIPTLMYVLQMLVNAGEKTGMLKYLTLFTLFDAYGIVEGTPGAMLGVAVMAVLSVALYAVGSLVFCRKDLSI